LGSDIDKDSHLLNDYNYTNLILDQVARGPQSCGKAMKSEGLIMSEKSILDKDVRPMVRNFYYLLCR
jgi:hypothetical protein